VLAFSLGGCAHTPPPVLAGSTPELDGRRTAVIRAAERAAATADAIATRPAGETAAGRAYASSIVLVHDQPLRELRQELDALITAAASPIAGPADRQAVAAHAENACAAAAALTHVGADDGASRNADGKIVERLRVEVARVAEVAGIRGGHCR